MDILYNLVGRNICIFQKIEMHLALLIYCNYNEARCDNRRLVALKQYAEIDDKSLGIKIEKIRALKIFESENDITILNFLKDERNYIAHNFFIENNFNNDDDIEMHKNELLQILREAELIEKALNKMVSEQIKQ